jgi:hypothetical protein
MMMMMVASGDDDDESKVFRTQVIFFGIGACSERPNPIHKAVTNCVINLL